jgi:hypothetical protein
VTDENKGQPERPAETNGPGDALTGSGEFRKGGDAFAPPPADTPAPTAPQALAGPPDQAGPPAQASPPVDPPGGGE